MNSGERFGRLQQVFAGVAIVVSVIAVLLELLLRVPIIGVAP